VLIKRNYTNLNKLTDNTRNCGRTGIIYFNCHGNALSRHITSSRYMCYQGEWSWLAATATKIFAVLDLYWFLQSHHMYVTLKVSVLQVKSSVHKPFLPQSNPANTVHLKNTASVDIRLVDLTIRQQSIRWDKMTIERTWEVTQNKVFMSINIQKW
jgi:hypothetical protein